MNSHLEFPEESVQLARTIANRYKKRSRLREQWAADLYDGHFLEIKYGFSESLKKGKCGLYLHEIIKEGECFTEAVAYYLVARELELEPKFFWATDMKDIMEGDHASEKGTMDHSFITVKIKKNIEKIIDPFMHAWGDVTHYPEKNEINIDNQGERKITTRTYAALTELSQQEIIKKMEQNRTRDGGRHALSGLQKIKSYHNDIYVGFNPEKNILFTKLPFSIKNPISEPYKKSDIYILETKVNDDGTFNFAEGKFKAYHAGGRGWSHHINEQEPMDIPVSVAQMAWDFFDKIMQSRERKKVNSLGSRRLKFELEDSGLKYDFTTENNSPAEKVANPAQIQIIKKYQRKSVKNFLERAREDEITWRVFLRDVQYHKAKSAKKSPENKQGYIYSSEEHEQFFLKYFEGYIKSIEEFSHHHIEVMKMRAGLKKGSDYTADRIRNSCGRKFERDSEFFSYLVGIRKIRKEPYAFSWEVDMHLFFEQFDVKNDSIQKLEKGLTKKDLVNGGKDRLFDYLIVGATRKNVLFAKPFHSGLQKILNRH